MKARLDSTDVVSLEGSSDIGVNAGPRVLIAGSFGYPGALEGSYERAFKSVGCTVARFDFRSAIARHAQGGAIGRRLSSLLTVEHWIRQANRELIILARAVKPQLVVVCGDYPARAGSLAQLLTQTGAKSALIWPDALVNLSSDAITTLPLFDLVASYSRAVIGAFTALGARRVEWVPLAGDPDLHPAGDCDPPICDVAFVGNWRPEREIAITSLGTIPGIDIKIWGNREWRKHAGKNETIRRAWQGEELLGERYAWAVRHARVALNIIDDTNYPAANMRFFEIPMAGGVQVSSPCPEMERVFVDGRDIFYSPHAGALPALVRGLLSDADLRRLVAVSGHALVRGGHTYRDRALQILRACDVPTARLTQGQGGTTGVAAH